MKKIIKLLKIFMLSLLIMRPFLFASANVKADELIQNQVSAYNKQVAETQQAIEEQLLKMSTMTEQEKLEEVERLLAEHEGETFFIPDFRTNYLSRSAGGTAAVIVRGGINFWAYSREGINKLANTFGWASLGEGITGGAAGIASSIAFTIGSIATGVLGAIIAAMGATVAIRFNDAASIMRAHLHSGQHQAGVRVTVTETIDTSSWGLYAYA